MAIEQKTELEKLWERDSPLYERFSELRDKCADQADEIESLRFALMMIPTIAERHTVPRKALRAIIVWAQEELGEKGWTE